MNLASLTQIQAAALLAVAPRTLRDWHDCPRNKDGSYNGTTLVAYYVGKVTGQSDDFDDQRERLAAAQAERVEMENATKRGQLARVDEVVRFVSDHNAAARAKLLSLPAKLSPQLVGIDDPNVIAAAIRADLYAALSELAEWVPAESEPDESGDAGMESTAGSDSKPMGRPGATAQ